MTDVLVVPVSAARTALLRQQVLRPLDGLRDLSSVSGDWFAAVSQDEVVGTVGVVREEPQRSLGDEADPLLGRAWRLRGMAVAPGLRGAGLGARLLSTVLEHAAARGGRLMWCHARTGAVTLYRRGGFRQVGDQWTDPVLGPHVLMWVSIS